jgi:NAD(P)-dependent dehydrogenase (short-subunit alcohol dehydrogenase family)
VHVRSRAAPRAAHHADLLAVLDLLSDKASYITGTELVVDGGRLALA